MALLRILFGNGLVQNGLQLRDAVAIFAAGQHDLPAAVEQAKEYIAQDQFAKGSMLPKVEAAIRFAESGEGRSALITLLDKAAAGIAGETGTVIHG